MFRNRRNQKLSVTFTVVLVVLLMLIVTDFIPEIRSAKAIPFITASKTDLVWDFYDCPGFISTPIGPNLIVDNDGDGQADPGDVLRYEICVVNSGTTPAVDVFYQDAIDANTTLVPGSINTTPIARNDSYLTTTNEEIIKDASLGVLANDDDPDGLGGLPGVTVFSADSTSYEGGTVAVAADGSFTYTPPVDFEGVDFFSYIAIDDEGWTDQGYAYILIDAPTASLDHGGHTIAGQAWNLLRDLSAFFSASPAHASGENFNIDLGDLDSGQAVVITFDVTIDSPFPSGVSEICNQGVLTGSNFANTFTDDPSTGDFGDPTCTPIDIDAAPDLAITKDDGEVTVPAGGTIIYSLSYSNTSTVDATGVAIRETVPANAAFNPGASTPGWVCLPDNNANSHCSLDIGTVAGGGGGQVDFAVDVDRPLASDVTDIINAVFIEDDGTGGPDPTPGDNNDFDITPIEFPDLQAFKDDGGVTVPVGGTISYNLTFTNISNATATGVVIRETVPANAAFNPGASTPGWVCLPDNNANSNCSFNIGTVAGGGSGGPVVFAVDVDSPLPAGVTDIINAVMVEDDGAGGPDPTPGDNYDFDITPIDLLELQITNQLVAVDEGQTALNDGTMSGGGGAPIVLSASVGTVTDNSDGTWGWSFLTSDGPSQSQTVTITAETGSGDITSGTFDLIVNNVAPVIETISIPLDPVNINDQPITASGTFSDPAGSSDQPYTCTVDYSDGTGPLPGTVTSMTCQGPDHTYASPGVFPVTVTVTDKDGGSDSAAAASYIVIYDPDGGFVTGGGWIMSQAGAYMPDPSLEGKATFGFVSKYKKGTIVPTGNTEFQFKVADLNFKSSTYDWLVVTGNGEARFKGTGTINGMGDYKFMIWAGDGEPDTFRIKIWTEDEAGNETVIYDNGFDQAIGGGSIVVHSK